MKAENTKRDYITLIVWIVIIFGCGMLGGMYIKDVAIQAEYDACLDSFMQCKNEYENNCYGQYDGWKINNTKGELAVKFKEYPNSWIWNARKD